MCWYTDNNNIAVKVAEEDLLVHKFFFSGKPDNNADYTAICQGTYYNIGEINPRVRLKLVTTNSTSGYIINKGYHSYAKGKEDYDWNYDFMVECIIPKGTKYYENEHGHIVSEQLIVGEVSVSRADVEQMLLTKL